MKLRSSNTGFERAIDPAYVRPLIERAVAGRGLVVSGDIRVPRVFPMREGCFSVEYRVGLSNGAGDFVAPLCGCFSVDGTVPERYASSDRAGVDASGALAVPEFGFDPRLDVMMNITETNGSAALHSLLPAGAPVSATEIAVRLIAHRLERRGVFRVELAADNGARVTRYLKVLRRSRASEVLAAYGHLREAGFEIEGLALPHVLHADLSRGLVLTDAAPGHSLHDCIDAGSPVEAMESAATLMKRLHELPVHAGLKSHGPDDEVHQVENWQQKIAPLYPDVASGMEKRVRRLRAQRPEACTPPVPVHGDFHDKQVLHARGRATLIDCDGLVAGDAARDYGNFVAHMKLRGLQRPRVRSALEGGLERFSARYPMTDSRLRWWTASALTRLAAVYSLRPAWRGLSMDLLDCADEELAREVAEK